VQTRFVSRARAVDSKLRLAANARERNSCRASKPLFPFSYPPAVSPPRPSRSTARAHAFVPSSPRPVPPVPPASSTRVPVSFCQASGVSLPRAGAVWRPLAPTRSLFFSFSRQAAARCPRSTTCCDVQRARRNGQIRRKYPASCRRLLSVFPPTGDDRSALNANRSKRRYVVRANPCRGKFSSREIRAADGDHRGRRRHPIVKPRKSCVSRFCPPLHRRPGTAATRATRAGEWRSETERDGDGEEDSTRPWDGERRSAREKGLERALIVKLVARCEPSVPPSSNLPLRALPRVTVANPWPELAADIRSSDRVSRDREEFDVFAHHRSTSESVLSRILDQLWFRHERSAVDMNVYEQWS